MSPGSLLNGKENQKTVVRGSLPPTQSTSDEQIETINKRQSSIPTSYSDISFYPRGDLNNIFTAKSTRKILNLLPMYETVRFQHVTTSA